MPGITLKNLPEALHSQLKQRARRHHRSLNGEVIALLQEAVTCNELAPRTQPSAGAPPQGNRRLPLPSFHGGATIPADFDFFRTVSLQRDTGE
jgi:plasmid stability protein